MSAAGLEPATDRLEICCSIHLSYAPNQGTVYRQQRSYLLLPENATINNYFDILGCTSAQFNPNLITLPKARSVCSVSITQNICSFTEYDHRDEVKNLSIASKTILTIMLTCGQDILLKSDRKLN
jgi:hypothetical protein